MLKYLFIFVTLIHGLIHFLGFSKAFGHGNFSQLTKEISKPMGVLWFSTAILFVACVMLYLFKKDSWVYFALLAVVLSQILIFNNWHDAKFGTIVNLIVLFVAFSAWRSGQFEAVFVDDVNTHLQQSRNVNTDILKEIDIQSLPLPVQKYIIYSGAIGKPKVKNMKIVFDGEMRDKGKDFFKFQSVQYNFFDNPARLFFMKAQMYGTMVPGYHRYQNEKASMQIKLLGLFDVVNIKGNEMNQAETVTVFNDICLMAPAALIDKRIEWMLIDDFSTKATFTNGKNIITAVLYFNEMGQLINFTSDDRYTITDMKQYRFSTPVKDYTEINGTNIWSNGDAVWHYPDGEFVYGKFRLKSIEYNVANFKK